MKTIGLTGILMAAALWLSGCTIISVEEPGRTPRLHVVCAPATGLVRVVHVPCPTSPDGDEAIE